MVDEQIFGLHRYHGEWLIEVIETKVQHFLIFQQQAQVQFVCIIAKLDAFALHNIINEHHLRLIEILVFPMLVPLLLSFVEDGKHLSIVSYIQHPGAWKLLLHLFSLIPGTFFLKSISHFIIIKVFHRWRITLLIGSFRICRISRWCTSFLVSNSFVILLCAVSSWRSWLNIDKAVAMRLSLSWMHIGLSWLLSSLLIL